MKSRPWNEPWPVLRFYARDLIEKVFPAELALEDSLPPEITKKLNLSQKELQEHVLSVLSLSVWVAK